MKKYTKIKVIRITEDEHKILLELENNNIKVGKFIRNAIAEKIKREYSDLLPKPKKEYCPF